MGALLAQRTWALPHLAAGCLALAAVSLLVHATPTYDPLSWLVWGREIAALELDTTEGPAFKPLPVAVTVLLAPLGDAAVWIWLAIARAAALFAAVLAWRIALRLSGGSVVAGAVAAVGVLVTESWLRHAGAGNSEGLLLALVLLALLRALDGHHRQAFALALGAALLRTETWPFLAAYALWLWRREPSVRPLIGAAVVALPLLWFGPDAVGADDPLRSSERAQIPNPGAPALAARPALESLGRAVGLMPLLVPAGVVLAVAAVRQRAVLLPAVAAALWIVLVAVMAELGYSGESRYAMPGVALLAIPAGVGLAWAVARVPALARRPGVVAGALAVAMVAGAAGSLAEQADRLAWEERFFGGADEAVAAAGGRDAVLACSPVHTAPFSRPAFAWELDVPISALSTETARGGMVFRSRVWPDVPVGPALEPPGGFTERGRAGIWQVMERC